MLRHGCGYALANAGHDTRTLQAWLGHRNIQHTACEYNHHALSARTRLFACIIIGHVGERNRVGGSERQIK
jgi:integrase